MELNENPMEKESDLYFDEISINQPIRRPMPPITITITMLEDLHNPAQKSTLTYYMGNKYLHEIVTMLEDLHNVRGNEEN